MHKHHSALGLASPRSTALRGIDIASQRPVQPVTLIRPHAASRAARFFVEKFPGRSMYAVKANPSPDLLQILWDSGVTHYDVASIAEVRLVARTLPEATLCFMHPVKAEEAIARGLFRAWRAAPSASIRSTSSTRSSRATETGADRSDALRAAARVVGAFEAQPRVEVRRRPRRGRRTCCSRPARRPMRSASASMSAARR